MSYISLYFLIHEEPFKYTEIESWVLENVELHKINYAVWSTDANEKIIVGAVLDTEQAVFFKLKFGL